MGHSKPTTTTKEFLQAAPLPTHGKTYTVVSHKEVIDHTKNLLNKHGFKITKELYRSNMNAKVAQGIYHVSSQSLKSDEELGMMFAWTNSYDKSTRFQCGVGAHVFVCNNGLIHGDMATYGRKHTGTANSEIASSIASQIGMGAKNFNQLVQDKNDMRTVILPITRQAELLGRLFIEEKLLDTTQISIVKAEIDESSYDYSIDPDTAWMFYNHITHAFKQTHPRNWMDHQSKFHKFMTGELLNHHGIKQQDNPSGEDVEVDLPPVTGEMITGSEIFEI